MTLPFLRNDAEAARHAAQFRPFDNAFGPLDMAYARRYGVRAADAAARCKAAAARGDTRALYLAQKALSTILYAEKPELFEQRQRKDSSLSFPRSEERRAERVSRSGGPAKATNAASLSERPGQSRVISDERKESLAPANAGALDPRLRGDDKGSKAVVA